MTAGDEEIDPSDPTRGGIKMRDFRVLMRQKMALLRLDDAFAARYVNEGFSGGEKKRLEMLQMAVLQPEFAVLDETDSGLDIDALRIVARGRQRPAQPGPRRAAHHPLPATAQLHHAPTSSTCWRAAASSAPGGRDLALQLEEEGYGPVLREAGLIDSGRGADRAEEVA